MRRGTTPTLNFILPFEVELIDKLNLTIAQAGEPIIMRHLGSPDIVLEDRTISIILTQEETLELKHYTEVEIQLRIKNSNDVMASKIIKTKVHRILEEEVL